MNLRSAFGSNARSNRLHTDIKSIASHLKETNLAHLAQAKLVTSVLKDLQNEGVLEAYLRGSLARGDADEHSDIDLFLVVEPSELSKVYEKYVESLTKEHKIVTSCYDRAVNDYGGIGFTFVALDKSNKQIVFDLYLAMKGVPPQTKIDYAQRVYSKDPQYCWFDDNKNVSDIPENTKDFLREKTVGDSPLDKAKLIASEMIMLMTIMQKHLDRNQRGRALNDTHLALAALSEAMCNVLYPNSTKSGLYMIDQIVSDHKNAKDPGLKKLANKLDSLLSVPPSKALISRLYDFTVDMLQIQYPEAWKEMKQSLKDFEQNIMPRPDQGDAGSICRFSSRP